MPTRARVLRTGFALGGWRGNLLIEGDVLRVVGDEPEQELEIDCAQVKRYSFNATNGMWALRMKDGRKLYLQTKDQASSAGGSEHAQAVHTVIDKLLRSHGARGFAVGARTGRQRRAGGRDFTA